MGLEIPAHQVENLEDQRVAYRIENLIACLSTDNNPLCPQNGKMLGSISLLDAELLNQRTSGELARPEQLKYRDSRGMGERLKELSFKSAQRIRHGIDILVYSISRI